MSEELENQRQDDYFVDHVVVRHPNGQSEKFPIPLEEGALLRIGRELDNDIVLVDPRSSRYHAELRRTADGIEIKDLGSANGTLVNNNRLEADTWTALLAGQISQMAETRLYWEKAASSQSTIAMTTAQRQAAAAASAPAVAAAQPAAMATPALVRSGLPVAPWMIGLAVALLLLVGVILFFMFGRAGDGTQGADQTGVIEGQSVVTPGATSGNLAMQTPSGGPTDTPTPSGPQLAIPVVEVASAEVIPILLGALPATDKALLLVKVRIQNVGNTGFVTSISDFSLRTKDGETLTEAGGTTSPEGLKRLGAIDRFNDLTLTPGGSVPQSLLYEVEPQKYEFDLLFEPKDVDPIILGLGQVDAKRDLALALGTPLAEETPTEVAAAATTRTPTPEPSPTPTRPPLIPAPQVVPKSALVGVIAYPVFNGNDYDLYFGQADGSGTSFFRAGASQPAFSADGSRIAFHSWKGDSRGLVTMDVSGANGNLVANFVEDQLPTWATDGESIIFLTRRSGGRQSQLVKADASTELAEIVILGEGEYPTIASNGQMAFKGWGQTAFGLRVGSASMGDLQTVTSADEDTAPALSPDGKRVVFMSKREGNWEVYVVNVDGSDLQRLTDDPAEDGLPTWSPDGNAIAFVSNRGGPWAVWAMTPDGSGQRQLFTMQGSPDGQVGTDTYASRGWAEERISWTK
jgi:TolB protein